MLVKILFPGSVLRYCGWGCAVCWVWGPLCPSTSAAGAVTFGAATAMPAGAGDPPPPAAVPGVPGPMQRQVDFLSSGGRCRSSSGGFDWRDVSQVAVPFACGFFSSAGEFYRSSSVFRGSGGSCQVLFVPVKILFPGSVLRYCGWVCAVCWVWGPLCPSTSAAGAVTFGAATAMPAGAGDPPPPAAVPGVPGPMQRQVDFLSSGGRCRSSSGGFDWRDVSQVAVPFACGFFSSAGEFYRSSSVF